VCDKRRVQGRRATSLANACPQIAIIVFDLLCSSVKDQAPTLTIQVRGRMHACDRNFPLFPGIFPDFYDCGRVSRGEAAIRSVIIAAECNAMSIRKESERERASERERERERERKGRREAGITTPVPDERNVVNAISRDVRADVRPTRTNLHFVPAPPGDIRR